MSNLNFNTEIRIFSRIIGETIKGITRTRLMNIVIITTMAAILSIFGCLFRTSLALSNFVDELGGSLEVSVYLKPGASTERLKNELLKINNIKELKIIPREQAWKELKAQMDVPNIKNPLPDTIRVKLNDQAEVTTVIKKIKRINTVEGIQYAKQLSDKITRVGNITNMATFIIILILGGLTLSIINNTIHLVIQSRKQEIEIMRMMGVGNWYIRAPYLLQGSFYGICGATFAIIPLYILQSYLLKIAHFLNINLLTMHTQLVIIVLLLMGVVVGAIGSLISVRKYLKI